MGRRVILVLLGLAAAFSFAMGFRSLGGSHERGWGPYWGERRLDALAEACVRAAERVRSAP
jgi:hypothetical protein